MFANEHEHKQGSLTRTQTMNSLLFKFSVHKGALNKKSGKYCNITLRLETGKMLRLFRCMQNMYNKHKRENPTRTRTIFYNCWFVDEQGLSGEKICLHNPDLSSKFRDLHTRLV